MANADRVHRAISRGHLRGTCRVQESCTLHFPRLVGAHWSGAGDAPDCLHGHTARV
ncbi:hypothetical protein JYU34_002136 [Plutella xylostella]|uniref:Uncharacterized protein n=1 Tax=Plutella xylostella TaxID=51655 RepID=A0ABQ7R1J0_PLUXY|nr:hypothetical protein JYU34_002136 [Plutella xylostella]